MGESDYRISKKGFEHLSPRTINIQIQNNRSGMKTQGE